MTEQQGGPNTPMVCATCLVPLDYMSEIDRSGGRYVHASQEFGKRTHVVVPIDPREAEEISPMCDFCYTGTPINWTVVAHPFTIETHVPGQMIEQNYSALWAACEDCGQLIARKRWGALVSRVVAEQDRRKRLGPDFKRLFKADVQFLYSRLEANFVAIRPVQVEDAYRADDTFT